ncbi:MAG TPA: helix-turn-helix domain-containing protein [Dermatophilaceae bacterium]|nr:helix-turn-helix domain-containing protein [Dermatophilaceae bacterium]
MAVAAGKTPYEPVLPLSPGGSVPVAPGVDVLEADGAGMVFLDGNAAWSWAAGDVCGRRLAAVGLVEVDAASQREVAAAFGVNETTLWRWRQAYADGGTAGLAAVSKGPRGPWKLTVEKAAEIAVLRARGLSLRAVAERVGVSTHSVARVLRPDAAAVAAVEPVAEAEAEAVTEAAARLEALARPAPRTAERQAARAGLLAGAAPRVTQGAGLPLAGALVILPALAATGLLEAAETVYGRARACFYGLRSLLLTVVFAALLGEPRAEGLTRVDPADVGRLLGLDRAPEVATLRRRMGELAAEGKADRLLAAMAARHVAGHRDACGVFYVDGHVRAYHGGAQVPKAHLARMRLSMPAETDTWTCDANGDGILVWQSAPGASLVGELRAVTRQIRALVGADARPTICFDRGGWSPKLFAELDKAGFDVLTYRKGPKPVEPASAFTEHTFTDAAGREHRYELADRRVRISYDGGRRRFACRQITRRRPGGHQTQIITTRTDADPAVIAHAMFSRWRQENFFRYLRAHYALDALDAYADVADDPDRQVPNPAKRDAARRVTELADAIDDAQADHDRHAAAGVPTWARAAHRGLADELADARDELTRRHADAKATPARAPVNVVRPGSRRLDPERKRLHDAVRLATYNAESALARLLAPHYARADDEARSLLREIFHAPADLHIAGQQLHVRVHPLTAPRRTRALAALCTELTATQTAYPGTDLTLVYSVKHR